MFIGHFSQPLCSFKKVAETLIFAVRRKGDPASAQVGHCPPGGHRGDREEHPGEGQAGVRG